MTTISIIVGSTRQGRFSEKPAQWILQHLQKRDGIEAGLLDLRDFPMPFFDQPMPPAMPGRAPYEHETVKRWTAAIAASDGFVFVTPEYNYGTSAVLKNAIDWVYPEWNHKAAAFVSYGSAMGARGIQQLRETMIEVQIAPVRSEPRSWFPGAAGCRARPWRCRSSRKQPPCGSIPDKPSRSHF